jgi:hypothetical protein
MIGTQRERDGPVIQQRQTRRSERRHSLIKMPLLAIRFIKRCSQMQTIYTAWPRPVSGYYGGVKPGQDRLVGTTAEGGGMGSPVGFYPFLHIQRPFFNPFASLSCGGGCSSPSPMPAGRWRNPPAQLQAPSPTNQEPESKPEPDRARAPERARVQGRA